MVQSMNRFPVMAHAFADLLFVMQLDALSGIAAEYGAAAQAVIGGVRRYQFKYPGAL